MILFAIALAAFCASPLLGHRHKGLSQAVEHQTLQNAAEAVRGR